MGRVKARGGWLKGQGWWVLYLHELSGIFPSVLTPVAICRLYYHRSLLDTLYEDITDIRASQNCLYNHGTRHTHTS